MEKVMTDINQPTPPPAAPPPPAAKPKRKRPLSRASRWADAAGNAQHALEEIEAKLSDLEEALSELRSVQEEYEQWKDNLPENLASSPLGEKLETVCDLQIEDAAESIRSAVDDVSNTIGEAVEAELPQGFGRD
jgi:DNA repair exonuclease SbcCD ATPase subunit